MILSLSDNRPYSLATHNLQFFSFACAPFETLPCLREARAGLRRQDVAGYYLVALVMLKRQLSCKAIRLCPMTTCQVQHTNQMQPSTSVVQPTAAGTRLRTSTFTSQQIST